MRRLGLVARFAVLSAVLITVLGIVLARSIGTAITNRNLASGRQTAVLVSRLAVQPRLSASELAHGLSTAQVDALNRSLRAGFFGRDVARIKIWNRDNRVVYSDDPNLIGKRFPSDDKLDDALDHRVTSSEVSNLTGAENAEDRSAGSKLLEVYTPIQFTAGGQVAGAFEIYLPYAPIAAGIHDDVLHLWVLLIAGLALLWAALSQIVLSTARAGCRHRCAATSTRRRTIRSPNSRTVRTSTRRPRPRFAKPSTRAVRSPCF